MRQVIVITAQHRTGSTWLLNLLATSESVTKFPEELNLYDFRLNTFERYYSIWIRKWINVRYIHGSYWKNFANHSYVNRLIIYSKTRNASALDCAMSIVREYGEKDIIVAKYIVHLRKVRVLREFSNVKSIVLYRSIYEVLRSKLNDDSTLRRLRKFTFCYKYILILWFSLEHRYYFSNQSEDDLLINYSDMVYDCNEQIRRIEQFIGQPLLISGKGIGGKPSTSTRHGAYKLTSLDCRLIRFFSGVPYECR